MNLSVFCVVSVDGFLARPDHTLDFLDAGGQEPHGFEEFYASVDVVVIGRRTFEVVLTFGKWFYGKKPVVVLRSHPVDFSSAQCWTQKKNGPDSRSTEPGLFFCYWHPEIVKNRRVRCELPRTPFERSPPSGIDLIGSVNTSALSVPIRGTNR